MTTIEAGDWLANARQKLAASSDHPLSEALALLGFVLDAPRSALLAHPETPLQPDQITHLEDLLSRLANGEPLPYLLGRWEFYGLELAVNPAVLIPRPETEQMVEEALVWLKEHPELRVVADVGTGSGAIAIALAYHIPDLRVTGTDCSEEAIAIARQNVQRYHLEERINLVQADLLTGIAGPIDLVCANLPYIPTEKLAGLPVAHFEPLSALDGGSQGLDLIARLLADLPNKLSPGGMALLEIEAGQGESAPALARQILPAFKILVLPDFSGLPRLLRIEHDNPAKN